MLGTIMSFESDGFFSPTMAELRSSLRSVPEYKAWFEFGEALNRLCLHMLEGVEVPLSDNQCLGIAALFIRAHKSFQSAITLAEFGLVGDARAVLRAAVEGTIATKVLADDAGFIERLINAHYHWQRKTARLVRDNPDYKQRHGAADIAAMERTVQEITGLERAGAKIRDINWADEALKHCPDLYNLLYRLLSSDGTHTNINAIHRMIEYDAAGRAKHFKIGPDLTGMVETLKAACLMILWAAEPFARAFSRDQERISMAISRFGELPDNEPQSVKVEAHFDSGATVKGPSS